MDGGSTLWRATLTVVLLVSTPLGSTDPTPAGEAVESQAPVVTLREGRVSGEVLTSARGRKYFSYTGIPFAQPPVGDRRFKSPRRLPENAWSGIKKCVDAAPKCPQLSYPERFYEGDEDCLYLNVYTHKLADTSQLVTILRPVLFWIHGGGFQHGSADFDAVGPERFMDNEDHVLLVTANYRLNSLGFLSIGEDPAMGNAGLKDQVAALNWVRSSIAHFGGDPGRTTVGGFQAGGVSAHLHALSPISKPDLFMQTFSMSGNALVPWAVITAGEARRRAIKLGRGLGCVKPGLQDDAKVKAPEVVRCLRLKPAEDLVQHSEDVLVWRSDISFPFVPVVENTDGHHRPFMTAHPREILKRGLRSKTWAAGVTTHEGLPQALQLMVFGGLREDLHRHFEERIWDYLGMAHILNTDARKAAGRAAGRRLRSFYLPNNAPITLSTLPGMIDLTSDALYIHSLHQSVGLHAANQSAPTFAYRFGYNRRRGRRDVLGVPQGTDNELLFPAVFAGNKSSLLEEEKIMTEKMLRLLSRYVSTKYISLDWPPARDGNFSFLNVEESGHFSTSTGGFYTERIVLWQSIFKEIEIEMDEPEQTTNNNTKDEL